MKRWNIRQRTIISIIFSVTFLTGLFVTSLFIDSETLTVDLKNRNLAPSLSHLFGTDWLGRDMLARTIKGLGISFSVGVLAAFFSTMIALMLSLLAATSKLLDQMVTWLIDLFLSVPHIVILILISFAFSGGFKGVVVGLVLTHWPSLTRILRSEMLQINGAKYVGVSRRLGKPVWWVLIHHMLPHLIPQLFIGFLLIFPHAILHEAAITFLGFGLPVEQPAIGVILSESMQYLSTGMWWLAFFPGLSLLLMVGIFDLLGESLRKWMDPLHGEKGRV